MIGFLAAIAASVAIAFGATALLFMRTVDPGHVGVFQYKPFIVGSGGIDKHIVVGPDRVYMWPSTSMWEVSVAPQTLTVHAEDFMAGDRVPLDFDVSVTIRVTDPKKTPDLIRTFGMAALPVFRTLVLQTTGEKNEKRISTGELMSFLRDQVRHHHSSVFIAAQNSDGTPSNAASEVENETKKHINGFLARNGASMIQVDNIALGRANPPEGVRKAIEATAQHAQESKTQVERLKAQETRFAAEQATAKAEKAFLEGLQLSGEQFIELERLKTWSRVCGQQNCTFVVGNTPVAVQVGPSPQPIVQEVRKNQ